MDKNTIIGLILIFAILIVFNILTGRHRDNSFKKILAENRESFVGGKSGTAGTGTSLLSDTTENTVNSGLFSKAITGRNEYITLENSKLKLIISLRGGRVYTAILKEYKSYNLKPLILFNGESTLFGFNFFTSENKQIRTNDLYFTKVKVQDSYFTRDSSRSVILRLTTEDRKIIEYRYTLAPDSYVVDLDVSLESFENITDEAQNSLTLEWKMFIPQQEKCRTNEARYCALKFKNYHGDVDDIGLNQTREIESRDVSDKISWVAFQDQFFSSVLISEDYFLNGSVSSKKELNSAKYLRYNTTELRIPYNSISSPVIALKFYFGPNQFRILKQEGYELEKLLTLGKNIIGGINRYAIIPVFNWLGRSVKNYGIIILILTVIIKIALFPLTFKSYQSNAKIAVLKPFLEDLGKKYPNNEDAVKKQQAVMALYKKAGVNPLGGCLPMLFQLPILFAMYKFFPVSIELRQEHFLWATDLSIYDSILKLPFTIPIYGDHVSLFTLFMTASAFLTMNISGSSSGSDQPGMKLLMYMSPVMFMLFLNNVSSGLTYYYFLANILTYAQNIISKRYINGDAVLLKLEDNNMKPVKISSKRTKPKS
jgi:YidC/Oxa1 family membrane protein insertase